VKGRKTNILFAQVSWRFFW